MSKKTSLVTHFRAGGSEVANEPSVPEVRVDRPLTSPLALVRAPMARMDSRPVSTLAVPAGIGRLAATQSELPPNPYALLIDKLNFSALTRTVMTQLQEKASDWMCDGMPARGGALTREVREALDWYRVLRERPIDNTTKTARDRRVCLDLRNQVKAATTEVARLMLDLPDLNDRAACNDRVVQIEPVMKKHAERAIAILTSYAKVSASELINGKIDMLCHALAHFSVWVSNASACRSDDHTIRGMELTHVVEMGEGVPARSRKLDLETSLLGVSRDSLIPDGLKSMSDLASNIEMIEAVLAKPLWKHSEHPLTRFHQIGLSHLLVVAVHNVPLYARIAPEACEEEESARGRTVSQVANALTGMERRAMGSADTLAGRTRSADPWGDAGASPSNHIEELGQRIADWQAIREQLTTVAGDAINDVSEESWKRKKEGLGDHSVERAAKQVTAEAGFCAEFLPVVSASLRSLRDDLQFARSQSGRSAEELASIKFLISHLEQEEFMARVTRTMLAPWLAVASEDPSVSEKESPSDAKATLTSDPPDATTLATAGSEGEATSNGRRKLTKAEATRAKRQKEREAKAARLERRRAGPPADATGLMPMATRTNAATEPGRQAERHSVDLLVHSTGPTTEPLPVVVTSSASRVESLARFPELGTTLIAHTEFVKKRSEAACEAMKVADVHIRARFLATQSFTFTENAQDAIDSAAKALREAHERLVEAEAVMRLSPHAETLAMDYLPCRTTLDRLGTRRARLVENVRELASAKPLLTGTEFIRRWKAGDYTLLPGIDKSEVFYNADNEPQTEIRAVPKQLAGQDQRQVLMHFHFASCCTKTRRKDIELEDLFGSDRRIVASIKHVEDRYAVGCGRLRFGRELANDLLAAIQSVEGTGPGKPR